MGTTKTKTIRKTKNNLMIIKYNNHLLFVNKGNFQFYYSCFLCKIRDYPILRIDADSKDFDCIFYLNKNDYLNFEEDCNYHKINLFGYIGGDKCGCILDTNKYKLFFEYIDGLLKYYYDHKI